MTRLALLLATSSLALAGCATMPAGDAPMAAMAASLTTAPLPDSVPTQLPRKARPTHYAIVVTPDATARTFTATAAIDLEVFEPTRTLVLNANDLTIGGSNLTSSDGGATMPLDVKLDKDAQTVTFTADKTIAPGAYRLGTGYSGIISTQANGLFALDYPDKATGEQRRGLFTQFEAPDARRFVPSFDEPSYKATFDLSAIVPADKMALSNMPAAGEETMAGGMKKVTFATTPKMSSYLLFFGLGDFERVAKPAMPGVEAGIVSPVGSGEQARFALDSLAPLIPYYSDYFGQKYPLPKVDNIAGPGQSQFFGAMENWGAIFTFERILLNDPANTSAATRQSIFGVQAHETAHQWFGDLVTMAWWDDLWLNEGFASWMATKSTDHFHPEWFPLLSRVNGREAAMGLDSFATTHPIVQKIATVEQTNQAFDAITYQKGEAVISMLEAFAGPDVWRDGLRSYMAAHKFGNAKTEDLWQAIEAAGATDLTSVARDFTTKPGIPLVTVTGANCAGGNTALSLTQSEFSQDRKAEVARQPQGWRIPLLVSMAGSKAAPMRSVMGTPTSQVTVNGCGTPLVNSGQLGYYRTLYTPEMLAGLAKAMPRLEPIDQLGLLADNVALAYADYQQFTPALNLLAAVPRDANPVVASSAIGVYARLYDYMTGDAAAQAKLASLASAAWQPRLTALGFEPRAGEPLVDDTLRSAMISALGRMGDARVQAEARRKFAALQADPKALDGPLKTTWLSIIARNVNAADWDKLLALASASTSSVERNSYYTLLGRSPDKALAQRTLDLALTDQPGLTTSAAMIRAVSGENPDMATDFVLANLPRIAPLIDASARAQYISRLAADSKDPAMIGKLETYAETLSADERKPIEETLAQLRNAQQSRPRTVAGIKSWLATR